VVKRSIPFARRILKSSWADSIFFADRHVQFKGNLWVPMEDGENRLTRDMGAVRQEKLEEIARNPFYTNAWDFEGKEDERPSFWHWIGVCHAWSPDPEKYEAWLSGHELASKLKGVI